MVSIPYTAFRKFCSLWNTKEISHTLRFGQAAYQYFQAEKCVQDKDWWDKLYNMHTSSAEKMLLSVIDYDN